MALCFILLGHPGLRSQAWEFVKEKDGIRTYTRPETGFSVKAYKCETVFRGDTSRVMDLITNIKNFDLWDDNISELVVVEEKPGKYFKYCLVYDLSWPVTDRDICLDAQIATNAATGVITVSAKAKPDLLPLHPDRIRITESWQNWIIEPLGDGDIRLTLEGFADPAGSVPAWITNMALTSSPLKSITEVRNRAK